MNFNRKSDSSVFTEYREVSVDRNTATETQTLK